MTVAAPPQPPPVSGSAGDDPTEALIKEAKQRARRRRWSYGGVAAVVVAIGAVVTLSIPPNTPSPHRAPRDVPTPPAAPLVKGPDAGSTLLASWGQIHVGYVFVYADGRVIWYPDGGVVVDADGRVTRIPESAAEGETRQYAAIERRLSARGLDLVRAGKLDPKRFLVTREVDQGRIWIHLGNVGSGLYQREELWAEPTARIFEPSNYAVCFNGPANLAVALDASVPDTDGPPVAIAATDAVSQLPAPAQALLNGKQRTYDPSIGTAHWGFPPEPPTECFEVTPAEKSSLQNILNFQHDLYYMSETDRFMSMFMIVSAIYPHRQYVIFGG